MVAPQAVCSACGGSSVAGGICTACGFASGQDHLCPHCGGSARVEPSGHGANVRWSCAICGGPRLPAGISGKTGAEPLRQARAMTARATRQRALTWVSMALGVLCALVLLAAWPASLLWKLFLLASIAAPFAWALRARERANVAEAGASEALDRAWLAAVEEVAAKASRGVTAGELARALKIEESRAERLLTALAAGDRTRIDVDDAAEIRYSVAAVGSDGKVRIDDERFRVLDEAEARAREEAEQLALLSDPFPKGTRR